MGVAVGEDVAGTGLGDGVAVAVAIGEACAPTAALWLAVAAELHAVTNTANRPVATALLAQVRSMIPPSGSQRRLS